MKLTELLNTKGKFKIIHETDAEFITSAQINGREIQFFADKRPGKEERWEAAFGEPNRSGMIDYHLSGKGGEFEVFAMVKDSLEEFIYMYDPKQIIMTAEKKKDEAVNRGRLYERLLKKFVTKDYKLTKSDNGYFDSFTLTKVKDAD